MTQAPSIKEALGLKPCPFCGGDAESDTPEIEREQVMLLLTEQWNSRTTLSQPTADRREIVAQIINPEAFDKNYRMNGRIREQQYAYKRADAILTLLNKNA